MSENIDHEDARKHYAINFQPEGYHEKVTDRKQKFKKEEWFFIESLTNIFKDHKLKGQALLDIGSGPTVHNIAPACKNFSSIVLSDYVESSCSEVRKWLKGGEDALDWSTFLRNFATALGYEDAEQGRLEIEALIRQKVKSVIHCDVLADRIVSDEFHIAYDAILTCLTLESACGNRTQFKNCLKKINNLLKLHGHLVMTGFFKAKFWRSGGHKFPYLYLSQDDIQNDLEEAGFSNIEWKLLPKSDDYDFDFEACYCLCCSKTSEIDI